jgi:hypothetical protein
MVTSFAICKLAPERAYNKALADFRAAQTERRKQKRDQSMLQAMVAISASSEPPSLSKTPGKMPDLASFRTMSIPEQAAPSQPPSIVEIPRADRPEIGDTLTLQS